MAVVAEATKGETTRRAVLRAAIDRFARDGYRATSVADIARDVGVSGSAPFAYFPTKEALFVAAVDHDAAALMIEGFAGLAGAGVDEWRKRVLTALLAAVDDHRLARRILAGREPEFTTRLLSLPALEHVGKMSAQRIRQEQKAGTYRRDVNADDMANGLVAIVLSLLMAIVQTDDAFAKAVGRGVGAIFDAALTTPK